MMINVPLPDLVSTQHTTH